MLFESLVALFDKFRQEILYSLLNESVPAIEERKAENEKMERAEEKSEARKDTKLVRFVHAVPKFVGKELEEYGPFEEDDIANLPNEIADVLMLKGRAEEIRED